MVRIKTAKLSPLFAVSRGAASGNIDEYLSINPFRFCVKLFFDVPTTPFDMFPPILKHH